MCHSWTLHELAELRRLSREGLPLREIAVRLGRTPKATSVRAFRLGLRSPRMAQWSTAEIRRARMMYDAGSSSEEIAVRLGRTVASVRGTLSRHGGLDVERKAGSRRKQDVTAYALWSRGLMLREILLVLGRDASSTARRKLCTWLHRYANRARLPVPPPHSRYRIDWQRVEEARRQMYGSSVAPLDPARAAS